MLVSNLAKTADVMMLGGGETHSFGLSDAPEFFDILSTSLYSDKLRAAIRETLSNAWDAHTEAGCPDLPIDVIIDDRSYAVRDYGLGLSPESIGPIYCKYGASTKVFDGRQTGGFGLGTKAPFAYSESFTVESSFAGQRSIYALVRKSDRKEGRPAATLVTQVPDDETGITVRMPLKSSDLTKAETLVRQIAFLAGRPCRLNGEDLDVMPVDASHSGIAAVQQEMDDRCYSDQIMIRYGTVVYPLDGAPEEVKSLLSRRNQVANVFRYQSNFFALLTAAPNSIAVTPTRESLSWTEKTTKEVVGLIQRLFDMMRTHKTAANRFLLHQEIAAFLSGGRSEVLNRDAVTKPSEVVAAFQGTSDGISVRDLRVFKSKFPQFSMKTLRRFAQTEGAPGGARYFTEMLETVTIQDTIKAIIGDDLPDLTLRNRNTALKPNMLLPPHSIAKDPKILVGHTLRDLETCINRDPEILGNDFMMIVVPRNWAQSRQDALIERLASADYKIKDHRGSRVPVEKVERMFELLSGRQFEEMPDGVEYVFFGGRSSCDTQKAIARSVSDLAEKTFYATTKADLKLAEKLGLKNLTAELIQELVKLLRTKAGRAGLMTIKGFRYSYDRDLQELYYYADSLLDHDKAFACYFLGLPDASWDKARRVEIIKRLYDVLKFSPVRTHYEAELRTASDALSRTDNPTAYLEEYRWLLPFAHLRFRRNLEASDLIPVMRKHRRQAESLSLSIKGLFE